MNWDTICQYLLAAGSDLLTAWTLILVAAGAAVFGKELREHDPPCEPASRQPLGPFL